jgi:hypothetical protein
LSNKELSNIPTFPLFSSLLLPIPSLFPVYEAAPSPALQKYLFLRNIFKVIFTINIKYKIVWTFEIIKCISLQIKQIKLFCKDGLLHKRHCHYQWIITIAKNIKYHKKELYFFIWIKNQKEITILILVCQCLLQHFLNSTFAIVSAIPFTGWTKSGKDTHMFKY